MLEEDHKTLSTKIRFIIDVIEGRIMIMNRKMTDIAETLTELKYPKIHNTNDDDNATNITGFNYLLKLPISQLTYDRKIILEKEIADLTNKLNELRNTAIEDIWKKELQELLQAWNNHKNMVIEDYQNDKNGIVSSSKAKKRIVRKVK
jgi:DNA topoisomerase-2